MEDVMVTRSTSFRISESARRRLNARADHEKISATTLLERLIIEGIDALDHPGVVHRGPINDRRAGLAGGPDVWEVIARLRELKGTEEQRIRVLADEIDLHPRLIRIALDYAAAHRRDIDERIKRNDAAAKASRKATRQRDALLR
ncbi:MAG: hypothetical protein WD826_12485 [Actinomycetota bacterium]